VVRGLSVVSRIQGFRRVPFDIRVSGGFNFRVLQKVPEALTKQKMRALREENTRLAQHLKALAIRVSKMENDQHSIWPGLRAVR
jgi:hypothetical protein